MTPYKVRILLLIHLIIPGSFQLSCRSGSYTYIDLFALSSLTSLTLCVFTDSCGGSSIPEVLSLLQRSPSETTGSSTKLTSASSLESITIIVYTLRSFNNLRELFVPYMWSTLDATLSDTVAYPFLKYVMLKISSRNLPFEERVLRGTMVEYAGLSSFYRQFGMLHSSERIKFIIKIVRELKI